MSLSIRLPFQVEFIRYHLAFQVADVYMLHSLNDRKVIEEESYVSNFSDTLRQVPFYKTVMTF